MNTNKFLRKLDRAAPIVFIMPVAIFLLLTCVVPILYSFELSFTRYNLFLPQNAGKFVGISNYLKMLTYQPFLASIRWTILFSVTVVLLDIVFGMLLALILNEIAHGSFIYKTIFIIPMMIAPAVIGNIWRLMLAPDYGVINNLLNLVGIKSVMWLTTEIPAKAAIIFVELWSSIPFCMLIFLGALKTVPSDLYEAAAIDGAGKLKCFLHITLPSIRNFIGIVVTIRVMDSLRSFDVVYNLTNGGPGTATETIGTTIYKTAFRYSDLGAGSAGAFLFFILITVVSFTLLRLFNGKKGGEEQ